MASQAELDDWALMEKAQLRRAAPRISPRKKWEQYCEAHRILEMSAAHECTTQCTLVDIGEDHFGCVRSGHLHRCGWDCDSLEIIAGGETGICQIRGVVIQNIRSQISLPDADEVAESAAAKVNVFHQSLLTACSGR